MSLTEEKNAGIIKKVVEREDSIISGDACENILNNVRRKEKLKQLKPETARPSGHSEKEMTIKAVHKNQ